MRDKLGKQSRVQVMKGLINHEEDMNFILKATEGHRGIRDIDQIYISKSSPWLWSRTGGRGWQAGRNRSCSCIGGLS